MMKDGSGRGRGARANPRNVQLEKRRCTAALHSLQNSLIDLESEHWGPHIYLHTLRVTSTCRHESEELPLNSRVICHARFLARYV